MQCKHILTTGILLIPFLFKAQNIPLKEDGYVLTEVIIKDSVPAKELENRAIAWVQKKHPKYEKVNAVGGTNKIECDVEFKIKPKELNPPFDFTGRVIMHVKIELKDGRYRYTINKVRHVADNGKNTGGDITQEIAQCGSLFLPEMTWKKIKGEAVKDAYIVSEDIKDAMSTPVKSVSDDW